MESEQGSQKKKDKKEEDEFRKQRRRRSSRRKKSGIDEENEETMVQWLIEQRQRKERAEYVHEVGNTEGYLNSGINLDIAQSTAIQLEPLKWYYHNLAPKKVKIANSGNTVILCAKWQSSSGPYITGGPLQQNKYVFSQLHFHWGVNELVGSEHSADGQRMPMELHAVHYKEAYESQEAARRFKDGIVILVYLFKLQQLTNRSLGEYVEACALIPNPGDSTRLKDPKPLTSMLRPFSNDYLLYWGSLTRGPSIRVMWLVSREPLGISQEQIAQFRTINDSTNQPILGNCREPGSPGNRTVFHVNPSGRCASTLTAIPPGPPALTANQVKILLDKSLADQSEYSNLDDVSGSFLLYSDLTSLGQRTITTISTKATSDFNASANFD